MPLLSGREPSLSPVKSREARRRLLPVPSKLKETKSINLPSAIKLEGKTYAKN